MYSRIILIISSILLIIHILNLFLGVMFGLLLVDPVHALRLSQLIDFTADESDEELLRELMGDRLAW